MPARRPKNAKLADASGDKDVAGNLLNDLGRRIVRGDFPPGSSLPTESEISKTYSVGRNAAREATKILVGKQLVRTGRGAGTIVQPRNEWNLLDAQVIQWRFTDPAEREALAAEMALLRMIIEPEAAAAAARGATTTQILRIFEAYENMESAVDDREASMVADIAFHNRVFEAVNNPLLMAISRSIEVLLRVNYELAIDSQDAYKNTLKYHLQIADAIRLRDPDAARKSSLHLLKKVGDMLGQRKKAVS